MAHLMSYWDESGKYHADNVVVFNGLMDFPEPWLQFFRSWLELLRGREMQSLHATDALKHSQSYGGLPQSTSEGRARDLLPFVEAITRSVALGIMVAVDAKAYKASHVRLRDRFRQDPHLFAFYLAISEILRRPGLESLTVGLIIDDEEVNSKRCYDLWTKLKRLEPEVRKRIPTICFADDEHEPALQAADLFANLCRREAKFRFYGERYPYRSLFDALTNSSFPERRLKFVGGFYGKSEIEEYVIKQVLPERQLWK